MAPRSWGATGLIAPGAGACGDQDWAKYHGSLVEFDNRHEARRMRRLARFQESMGRMELGQAPRTPAVAVPSTGQSERRLPAAAASLPRSPSLPRTAASRPRTSSTTLSCLWRRALSTPDLSSMEEAAYSAAATMGSGAKLIGKRNEEDWRSASDHVGKEELAQLVEHVHAKVLSERRRRKDVEAQLAASRG